MQRLEILFQYFNLNPGMDRVKVSSGGLAFFFFEGEEMFFFSLVSKTHSVLFRLLYFLSLSKCLPGHAVGQRSPFVLSGVRISRLKKRKK